MATTDEYYSAKEAVSSAERQLSNLQNEISQRQQQTLQLERDLEFSKSRPDLADLIPSQTANLERSRARILDLQSKVPAAEEKLATAQSTLASTTVNVKEDPQSTVKTPEATNPSATDEAAAERQATGTIEGTPPTTDNQNEDTNGFEAAAAREAAEKRSKPTSQPEKPKAATPKFQGGKDHRVRLKVPTSYLVGQAAGPNSTLVRSQGIIFPYTPTIGQEHTASYNSVPVTHSNYTQYFYRNSSVGTISLSAKFTVQNDYEAEVFFSVVHLLRALTKMRYGDDDNAGSPPPVCRLFAYGDAIMNNVPVAISSFKLNLPDNVDYFTTKSQSSAPTLSTIDLTLTPIYSRNEMQRFTVTDWLSNNLRSKGYL